MEMMKHQDEVWGLLIFKGQKRLRKNDHQDLQGNIIKTVFQERKKQKNDFNYFLWAWSYKDLEVSIGFDQESHLRPSYKQC